MRCVDSVRTVGWLACAALMLFVAAPYAHAAPTDPRVPVEPDRPRPPGVPSTGPSERSPIRAVVRRHQAQLQRCYERASEAANQTPTLRYDVRLHITAAGAVSSAAVHGPDFQDLRVCLRRSVSRWRFPASGSATQTLFPVVFRGPR